MAMDPGFPSKITETKAAKNKTAVKTKTPEMTMERVARKLASLENENKLLREQIERSETLQEGRVRQIVTAIELNMETYRAVFHGLTEKVNKQLDEISQLLLKVHAKQATTDQVMEMFLKTQPGEYPTLPQTLWDRQFAQGQFGRKFSVPISPRYESQRPVSVGQPVPHFVTGLNQAHPITFFQLIDYLKSGVLPEMPDVDIDISNNWGMYADRLLLIYKGHRSGLISSQILAAKMEEQYRTMSRRLPETAIHSLYIDVEQGPQPLTSGVLFYNWLMVQSRNAEISKNKEQEKTPLTPEVNLNEGNRFFGVIGGINILGIQGDKYADTLFKDFHILDSGDNVRFIPTEQPDAFLNPVELINKIRDWYNELPDAEKFRKANRTLYWLCYDTIGDMSARRLLTSMEMLADWGRARPAR